MVTKYIIILSDIACDIYIYLKKTRGYYFLNFKSSNCNT